MTICCILIAAVLVGTLYLTIKTRRSEKQRRDAIDERIRMERGQMGEIASASVDTDTVDIYKYNDFGTLALFKTIPASSIDRVDIRPESEHNLIDEEQRRQT